MHVLYNLCPFFSRKVCWTTTSTRKVMEGGGVRLWSSEDDISKNHWNWKSTAIFLKKKVMHFVKYVKLSVIDMHHFATQ